MPHPIFSYGTLCQPGVQRVLYGREVPTEPDILFGFRLDSLDVSDPDVLSISGTSTHPILVRGQPDDSVAGSCLHLTEQELAATDDYEVDDYRRIKVKLGSGRMAWVYVALG